MARYAHGQAPDNNGVINLMNNLIDESFERLQGLIPDNDEDVLLENYELDIIKNASQANAGETVYDSETAPFYICRYSKAYIYEYALIYDILLRIMRSDGITDVNMLSLGCGSMIDAFSMVFAASKLSFASANYMNSPDITYTGVDLAPWNEFCLLVTPDTVNGTANLEPNTDSIALRFDSIAFFNESMFEYLRRNYPDGSDFDKNVIVFPKVLNTIANDTDLLLDRFRNLNFPQDEYFIVVSHAESSVAESMSVVDRLIGIINQRNEFEVSSDLKGMLGGNENDPRRNKWKKVHNSYIGGRANRENIDPDNMLIRGNEQRGVVSDQNCYIFSNAEKAIANYRPEFLLGDIHDYLKSLENRADTAALIRANRANEANTVNRVYRVSAITSVRYFTFEIIKLKRTEAADEEYDGAPF